MPTWKAEVTLSDVPALTDEVLEEIVRRVHGTARYNADTHQLFLVWRFEAKGMGYALDAAGIIRAEVARDLGGKPACTDIRVQQVTEEVQKREEAELAKVFAE